MSDAQPAAVTEEMPETEKRVFVDLKKQILQDWFDAAIEYTKQGGFMVFFGETCDTLFKVVGSEHADFIGAANVFEAFAKKAGYEFPNDPDNLAFIEEAI